MGVLGVIRAGFLEKTDQSPIFNQFSQLWLSFLHSGNFGMLFFLSWEE